MQHPLVNPSLAPYGFVFPASRERLDYTPAYGGPWVNTEVIISRLWEEVNRADAPRPLPLVTIIHKILPGQAASNALDDGDFEFAGVPFLSRDVALISTFVQWFGTNVGNTFIDPTPHVAEELRSDDEFVQRLLKQNKQHNLTAHLIHTCTSQCSTGIFLIHGTGHDYRSTIVTERDRAVVDGLMRWLGTAAGRAFVIEYLKRRDAAWIIARKPITDAVAKVMAR